MFVLQFILRQSSDFIIIITPSLTSSLLIYKHLSFLFPLKYLGKIFKYVKISLLVLIFSIKNILEVILVREVYEFLKKANTYYLATVDGDQPSVRPFGTANIFEDKLYIQTGKSKNVSKQMMKNPKISICAMDGGDWIRIHATVVEDDRVEPKQSLLDAYPHLKSMYSATDGNHQVLYLKDAVATISSRSGESKVIKF
jgi:uncharacterized pyridoxamine 5'-phosphate oxidase family protein